MLRRPAPAAASSLGGLRLLNMARIPPPFLPPPPMMPPELPCGAKQRAEGGGGHVFGFDAVRCQEGHLPAGPVFSFPLKFVHAASWFAWQVSCFLRLILTLWLSGAAGLSAPLHPLPNHFSLAISLVSSLLIL